MSSVLKTVKWFLWKNAHAKTESNSKGEKVNILKMIRAILANVLLVGLERKIENPEKYKEKTNNIVRKKIKMQERRNTRKIKVNIMRRIQSIEQKTKTQ